MINLLVTSDIDHASQKLISNRTIAIVGFAYHVDCGPDFDTFANQR